MKSSFSGIFVFFFDFFLFLYVFCCFLVFFGGFKGQVRWPFGPPHLALNPPYLFFLFVLVFLFVSVLFFFFPFFASHWKTGFPLKKAFLFIFERPPLFLLSLFWPPPFSVFSFSVSLLFFSFFLLVFVFCFLLVPCSSLFLSFSVFFAFVSWKEQHQKIQLQSFFINPVSFFPVLFSLWNSVSYLIFPDFQLCFLFNINVVGFKKHKLKSINFWSKGGGVATKRFFNNLCFVTFVKSEKSLFSLFLLPNVWPNFGWWSKTL